MTITIVKTTGRPFNELVKELFGDVGQVKSNPKEDDLLGLERKPSERKGKTTPEAVLLTVRSDLVSVRERLLKGVGRKATLRDLDYTIDQLDNALGEM